MGDIKAGEPFGLNDEFLEKIDWALALRRVVHDARSDFIYAPHLSFVYSRAGDALINILKSDLKAGTYSPGVPINIEVPKSFRMTVASQIRRLGPNFSRPGSILLPRDRLLYQALADEAAPIIDAKTDGSRSFSHALDPAAGRSMFLPTRTCWNNLQQSLRVHSQHSDVLYVLKVDVANFFGSINQHELINVLSDSGYPKSLYSRLEALLTSFTGDRSSRGLLQGMYPSDLFGNFYLAPIDKLLEEQEVPSARYVDDIYIFVKTVKAAEKILREIIPGLRSYDLVLNEAKSKILLKSSLMTEEPDLEALFEDAVQEISEQIEEEDLDADYGFQAEWDEDEDEEEDEEEDEKRSELELAATKLLFDSMSDYKGHEENIERFCLPLFVKAKSDYALQHVIAAFKVRPAMSQIYSSYLANFLNNEDALRLLLGLLADSSLVDWQRMWVLAALSQAGSATDEFVKVALSILKDGDRHEALRSVAAVYVGRFGEHHRRKSLVQLYASVPPYIQSAIYFSSRNWPQVERSNAKATWGHQSPLNQLLTLALSKKTLTKSKS